MLREYEELFQTLYETYAEQIQTLAYRLTGDMGRAEEIRQDTFWVLLLKIEKVSTYDNPAGFLFKTLKNKVKKAQYEMDLDEQRYTPLDEDVIPDERNRGAAGLMEILPPSFSERDARMLHMYYEEARSIKEIADAEGISESACKMRIKRLRDKLKENFFDEM